ncbi:MAG: endonuclease VII domain-containing protein [Gammaproteobacteria bacterium]|nr:endonuclease VII domain-containing protein [Gammaproteobacteria bacterium]
MSVYETYSEKQKAQRRKANRKWAAANKDYITPWRKANSRRSYRKHAVKILALAKANYNEVGRSKVLFKKYGVTEKQYAELFNKQNGACAICATAPNWKRLAVDHNHDTGHVRGLLCAKCNRGIGLFSDDRTLLDRAIRYLNTDSKKRIVPRKDTTICDKMSGRQSQL